VSMIIREATETDREGVVALWQSCDLTRSWNDPVADFDRALAWLGSTVFVIDGDAGIIASAMTGYDGHRGWIYYLAVAPEARGTGLARALLDRCGEWLAALGCPKVELMVRDGNPHAGIYPALGWERSDVSVYARWLDRQA